MTKEDLAQLLAKSKANLDKEHQVFAESIRKDLDSFKKKAMSKI